MSAGSWLSSAVADATTDVVRAVSSAVTLPPAPPLLGMMKFACTETLAADTLICTMHLGLRHPVCCASVSANASWAAVSKLARSPAITMVWVMTVDVTASTT